MTGNKLLQKFPETVRQREDRIFARFTPSDFAVVRLEDIREEDFTPIGVARIVVEASNHGNRPVDLRAKDTAEFVSGLMDHSWKKLIGDALESLGYDYTQRMNKQEEGYYYVLNPK